MDEASENGDNICPLCMEEMDLTDRQLKPCGCGYQVCVWCWHHIMEMAEKESIEGRCPACRTPYDKEKIFATTFSYDRTSDLSNEKKPKANKAKGKALDARKNLSNVRVIQRNLVYVVGISVNLADEETLQRREYFGQYGKILKISVSKSTSHNSQHSISGPTASVYVTFLKEEDALRCIQAVNGYNLDGRVLKACFGTTKYCNAWLKHMPCNNPDCLYLHDEGTREDSFTKEQMLARYGSKNPYFHDLTHPTQRRPGVGLPPPVTEVSTISFNSHPASISGSHTKPSLSNGSFGKHYNLPAAASWGSCGTSAVKGTSVRASVAVASTKMKSSTSPMLSASLSSGQASSSETLQSSLATSGALVLTDACGPISEHPKSSSTVLGNSAIAASGQLHPTAVKPNNVKGLKTSDLVIGGNSSASVSSFDNTLTMALDALSIEVEHNSFGTTLQVQGNLSENNEENAISMEDFGVQDESGEATGHVSYQNQSPNRVESAQEMFICSPEASSSDADNCTLSEPVFIPKSRIFSDDSRKNSANILCSMADETNRPLKISQINIGNDNPIKVEVLDASTCVVLPTTEIENTGVVDSVNCEMDIIKSLPLLDNGELVFDGLSTTSHSTSPSPSDGLPANCSHEISLLPTERDVIGYSVKADKQKDMSVLTEWEVIGNCEKADNQKDLADSPLESLKPASLNVGGLSIILNTELGIEGHVSEGKFSDTYGCELLKDPWLQGVGNLSQESSESTSVRESVPVGVSGVDGELDNEKSVTCMAVDSNFSKQDQTGLSESCKGRPLEVAGEKKMISDMLAMGYDIWADSSPHDLAKLLFKGKHTDSLCTSSPKEIQAPWKSQNAKQSRFHFARQEDSNKEPGFSSGANTLLSDSLTPRPTLGFENEPLPIERYGSNLFEEEDTAGQQSEALAKICSLNSNIDKLNNASNTTRVFSAEPSGTTTSLSSKPSISAPPGFGLSTRVSTAYPPGFLIQNKAGRPPDSRAMTETIQTSDIHRSVSRTALHVPSQAFSRENDVEFIDPAIMAVGKGKVPATLGQAVAVASDSPLAGLFSQALSRNFGLSTSMQQQPLGMNPSFLLQERSSLKSFSSGTSSFPISFLNDRVNTSFPSFLPALSDGMDPSRVFGYSRDGLNASLSQMGIREPVRSSVVPQSRLSKFADTDWDNWESISSGSQASFMGQSIAVERGGQTLDSRPIFERIRAPINEVVPNKETGSNFFGEAVTINRPNDQGPYVTPRINRYSP